MIWIQRAGLILAIAIIVGLSIWLLNNLNHSYQSPAATVEYPNAYMLDVTATQMNDEGTPESILKSPQMIHYQKDNSTLITLPDMYNYSPDEPTWHITAINGKANDGIDIVYLWQNVVAQQFTSSPTNTPIALPETSMPMVNKAPLPLAPTTAKTSTAPIITITTSAATIYPHKKYITSDQPATFIQPGITVNSTGFNADMKQGSVTLLSQAQGTYNPQ